MRFSGYQSYRKSNSPWLGDIPAHWKTKKLKFLATVQPSNVDKKTVEGEEPVLLCNYTDVYKNEYIDGRLDFMQASATEDEIGKFAVDIGDVIVTKDSETPDDIAVPACVTEKIDGLLCGYHLTQIKPIYLDGKYLFRLFQSEGFNAQFTVAANGVTRFGLPQYAIANAFTPVPPIDEQKTIARFLDFKTAQIDALITRKQALLDKLAEKRTALISHAVTKGLDPSVPMKDSGVAWLGEIPAHWEVKRLKFVSPFITVGIVVEPSKYYVESGIPALRSLNVKRHQLITDDLVFISPESNDLHAKSKIFEGDLVAVRSGQPGTTAIVDKRFHGANCIDLIIIRKPTVATSEFLDFFLNSKPAKAQFESGSGGAIQQHFNITTAGNLIISCPSIKEQTAIATFLDRETAEIDALATKIEQAILSLQEHRSALITHAVTGKIDVRGFAVPREADT